MKSKKQIRRKNRSRRLKSPMHLKSPIQYQDKTSFKQQLKTGVGYGVGFELADLFVKGVGSGIKRMIDN